MIFSVDPEDRDRRHVVIARHLIGKLQGGESLEQREKRTAEQPRLLTGQNRDRTAIGQTLPGFDGSRGRVAVPLLRGNHGCDLVTAPMVFLTPVDGRRPGRAIGRIAGEERRDGVKVVGVISGKSADPRKTPNIDRNPD